MFHYAAWFIINIDIINQLNLYNMFFTSPKKLYEVNEYKLEF